ncbi:hypothetical protein BDW02DRAFT_220411 [Decorospora gaudefroyi]|uniref:Uncharacterized protein n=1 Tax=Decorospora gaudefroyi TaxID=184978 RepID=A0A6A5KLW1_9PLEO|nr:hypothetical protein BDW02DRAFT_220411 [Decorospora gaudefroyi]
MAAANSYQQRQKHHLPPSPPPSPPSTRRRHRKKVDPFDELATAPIPSPSSALASESEDDPDSAVKRILFTPILFISFLISLFLVNYRDRARRAKAQSSSFSILAYLAPSSWFDPEPYQDPDNSTWGRRGTVGHVEPHDAIGPRPDRKDEPRKRKSWHLNRNIRKMAKLEIGDALEMRRCIIAGMIAVLVMGTVALWMGLKWFVGWISTFLLDAKA